MNKIRMEAIVIGASAGALEALMALLPNLPSDYPLPILIVVHLPGDKKSVMAELFEAKCKLKVKEAEDKEPIQPATIYFAPPDYHLLVEVNKTLSLSSEEPVLYSRPSIDVLFETAADAYGPALTGIVLTGANNDGANGAKTIIRSGGQIWIQNPDNAYAKIMPEAAVKSSPGALIMNLDNIATAMQKVIL